MNASTVKLSTREVKLKDGDRWVPGTIIRIDVFDNVGFDYTFETIDPVAARIKLKELGYAFLF